MSETWLDVEDWVMQRNSYRPCWLISMLWLVELVLAVGVCHAQPWERRWGGRRGDPAQVDRSQFPMWQIEPKFADDVFTFVRIKTTPYRNRSSNRDWSADYPDADFYFSWRLHQLTTLQVNPNPLVLELTDPRLFDHPFVFLAAPQSVNFSAAETASLRRYLLNGGFMMCDEFFGTVQWQLFRSQLKKLFPEFEPVELDLSHEIFHMVYDFDFVPQVTAIHFWQQFGITYHPVAPSLKENCSRIRSSQSSAPLGLVHNPGAFSISTVGQASSLSPRLTAWASPLA